MKDRRRTGQSQLDYLWTNYGGYSVSSVLEENSIPTTELLQKLVDNLKQESLNSIKVVGDRLVGTNSDGEILFTIDIDDITTTGKSLTNFGKRYITNVDVENGCELPEESPVYFIRFSDNTELIAPIDQYCGIETNSVVVTIDSNQIYANVKINNQDSIVTLNETAQGLQADLKVSSDEDSIQLTKELEGLKAKILLDNAGRVLKFKLMSLDEYQNLPIKDTTTVYFLRNKKYFYFGEYLIGEGASNLDDYYTKQEIDDNIATKQYVQDSLADVGMNWKSV